MKTFIDCGYYSGKAIEYYAPFLDDSWTVYAFEPNDTLNVKESIKRFPFKVKWIKKAVWIKDGTTGFNFGGREDAAHLSDIHDNATKDTQNVKCIDFSKFVGKLPEGPIVCSMDIEGAEFFVLEKMLKDGTAQRLSLLDIEFHHRLVKDKTPADASALRMALESEGVLVKLKLEL